MKLQMEFRQNCIQEEEGYEKEMRLFMQLCFIGMVMCLPVLQWVKGEGNNITLSIVDVSHSKAVVLLIALLIGVCLDKTKFNKLTCVINVLAIPYVAWLTLIAYAYADEYTVGNMSMVCNYGVYVLMLAYLATNVCICIKRIRETKEQAKAIILFKPSVVGACAVAVCGIVLTCGLVAHSEVINARNVNVPTEEEELSCSFGSTLVTVSDLDSQETVYRKNKKINIPYVLLCQEDESFYVYLPENKNIKFHTKDKQKVCDCSEFNIEFKVKNDGANEIEFTLMTDSETPEMETKFYVYTYTADNMTFVDFDCVEYAEEAYYEWLLEQGKIDLEEYDRIIEDRHTLKEEDGTAEVEIVESKARASSSTITIRGQIKWQDVNGITHGANEIRVEVWDQDDVSDDYITSVYTNSNGSYSVTIENDTSLFEGGYDLYIKICARGRYVNVVDKNDELYYTKKYLGEDINNGANIAGNFTFSNGPTIYRAFQAQQAAAMASSYIYKRKGNYLTNLTIHFPNNEKSVSSYSNNNIFLISGDYCDWDIIQHEYGHHVAAKLGFDESPGGKHGIGTNSCDVLKNKDKGLKLAWSEGWATYFAIALQQSMGAKSLNIPNVGDLYYTNTINSTLNQSIETPSFPRGEGDGMAVAAVLLDIADSTASEDMVALGYTSVYNYITKNKCVTLYEFIKKIQGASNSRDLYLGDILSSVNVSCLYAKSTVSTTSAKFSWKQPYSSSLFDDWSYTVIFYNSSYSKISEITVGNVREYTLTASQWSKLRSVVASGKTVYWTIKATEKSSPITGPYFSERKSFVMP